MVWDATYVEILAQSHLHRTSTGAGAAAAFAKQNYIFASFEVETMGTWAVSRLIVVTSHKKAVAYLGQRIIVSSYKEPTPLAFLAQFPTAVALMGCIIWCWYADQSMIGVPLAD